MISEYVSRINIGTPKVKIVLEKTTLFQGEMLEGSFHIVGSFFTKTKVKRYDIELIARDLDTGKEQIYNERVVYSTLFCKRSEQSTIPFCLKIPKDLPIYLHYLVRARVALENVEKFEEEFPITLKYNMR
ncbi:sporulation-control protein [Metabacillus crassostreae]|uniref:sporulation protein n=1 Tax=Metabacillus crassostreae TaxID=929098 RepID=UPI001956D4E6|nr:sporulation protein [Metabacillus crassostreae]MBM7603075.1 sporulation-control protein [Metabacillus crassostreae]